ncbi:fluoroquinolones efflux ABC transporter permease [Saccharopolyspora halophila]|uniref:Fluoroquinolones efflux ABC transporter permease n=1 Tax=Saccharopolyspora halophila TaxID=405551 RepID=A0ABN3GH39_9PSEU
MTRALVGKDLRGLLREPLLIGLLIAPVAWTLMVRLPLPAVSVMVRERFGLELGDYHALILTGFLVLTAPVVTGGLAGLMALDERDEGTLQALRVSPLPMSVYVRYRAGAALVLTTVITLLTTWGTGLLPAAAVPGTLLVGVLGGSCALLVALLLLGFAGNKVEGVAIIRALGLLLAGVPLVPYFLDPAWQWPFGIVPTYWPSKTFWVVFDGGTWWPYLAIGLAYNALLVWPLYRRVRGHL